MPIDLAKVGYEEQEYFIRGVATSYAPVNPSAANPIGEMPYETRIVSLPDRLARSRRRLLGLFGMCAGWGVAFTRTPWAWRRWVGPARVVVRASRAGV